MMKNGLRVFWILAVFAGLVAWLLFAQGARRDDAELWQHRNLGKAFYENPTTQAQAVTEFRKALDLAPNSAREIVNYGLALLRAGDTKAGITELQRAQKLDPQLPHPWFNLGIAFKNQGDLDAALTQFRGMSRLVPSEPVTHYQIGTILKAQGDLQGALKEFESARDLNPLLAAPHFQLYGLYRQLQRPEEAAKELATFQQLKKSQEGAAVPEDMSWSWYAEIYDPADALDSAPPAEPVYRGQRLGGGYRGAAAFRLDSGPRPSLMAWSQNGITIWRDGTTPATGTGLEGLRDVVTVAPGDFDNDGLTDLCVVTTRGAALYRNVHGEFRKQADLAVGFFRQAVWLDFDHDYDLDLFLLGADSKLLRNNGSAGFSDETARFPFVSGEALSATPFDLEPDTPGFDLVVSYKNRTGVLYRDRLAGNYQAIPLQDLPAGSTLLRARELDHDGRTDLVAEPPLVLWNRPAGFQKAPAAALPAAVEADFEGRGRLDRAQISSDGTLTLDRDVTRDYGNWIEVMLTGLKNLKSPIGAKVEVKSGTRYEKQTWAGTPLLFRLGRRTQVDTVRITWPNGLIQNEMNQPINKLVTIQEAQRLSGSCPMIFTWNGKRFEFLTDVLGVAPLGASSGDGRYFPVDHDEYVSIPGEALRERGGAYEIRVTEELHEVSYIDQVRLQALDHPANLDIITNEKFKSPPFPEFRLFGVSRRIPPVAAYDQRGQNVLPSLLYRDGQYPNSFRRNAAGVAELHTLELDFGAAAPDNHAVLVLQGWVDWADGSTFLSAMQAHQDLVFPYLQVKDSTGHWKTVIEDMGIPSGKPKAMAVDLTGKFLSASRAIRIVTNLCVYWDEAFLIENEAAPPTRLTTAPSLSADLHFRGFSRPKIDAQRLQPEQFDYETVSYTSSWNPTAGNYTRYGDVRALVSEADDQMVIMGSGDEISLRFDARHLPPLPKGWKRDFLLLVDGWAKDADANTAFSQSVLPLPFHGMSSYPYPPREHYPQDAIHQAYQRFYNIRPALKLIRPLTETGIESTQ
jgi:tetratricopeptide (TPR) repeat protein